MSLNGFCCAEVLTEPSPSHAREPTLWSCAGNRPHIALMAGSPLKRQRKAGIRADDGSVIAFPYMPRAADLPRGWRHWSPAEKIEHHLLGRGRLTTRPRS
jgi:hypothetical protein